MMTLEECSAHLGAEVEYTPTAEVARNPMSNRRVPERGTIQSVGQTYVAVRYTGGVKATLPADLALVAPPGPRLTPKRQERQVRLTVHDAELRPAPSDRHGLSYRPDELLLTWTRAGYGEGQVYPPQLSGPKIKRDGTASQHRAFESFHQRPAPQWVLDALAQYLTDEL